jgi:hypothetical protein
MPQRRVCVFDVPLARPVDGVDGVQVLGWGTEVNQCLRVSRPEPLMAELIARHGGHPLFEPADAASRLQHDGEAAVLSYRIPSSYDVDALADLSARLCVGAERRGRIMRDLLARAPWDVFLGVFSETHTSSHLLWHLSQPHPLRDALVREAATDPMRRVFQAVDDAIGSVVAALPDDAQIVLFSIYGIGANVLDVPSMAVLPETLFRWSFPGETALAPACDAAMPLHTRYGRHWKDEVWDLVAQGARSRLESPQAQASRNDPLAWQPANWYRPLWPGMKAFALPTYSEGLVRLNVEGREASGIVPRNRFAQTCDEVCALLDGLVDARTGRRMARQIVRTRRDAFAPGAPADLIVLWQEDSPTDVVDSAQVGRIGPLPYFRTGGHSSRGFVLAAGPGVEAGVRLADITAHRLPAFLQALVRGRGAVNTA